MFKNIILLLLVLLVSKTTIGQDDSGHSRKKKKLADNSEVVSEPSEATSPVKSFTSEEYDNLKNGNGMGLARAAELNNYPGPMHVLELQKELKLTAPQKTKLEAARDEMKRKAIEMGGFIIQEEKKLNNLFAASKIDEGSIIYYTNKIGLYQGELRNAHLQAHLKARRILTPDQISRYNKLRGNK